MIKKVIVSSTVLLSIITWYGLQTLPVKQLTEQEHKQFSCLWDKYKLHNGSGGIGGFPEKPYVSYKGKKVYLSKKGCE